MSTRHGELDHHELAELLTAGQEYEGVRASDDGLVVAGRLYDALSAFKGDTVSFKGRLGVVRAPCIIDFNCRLPPTPLPPHGTVTQHHCHCIMQRG